MTTLEQDGSVIELCNKSGYRWSRNWSLGGQFGESGQVQEGDVISFGVKTKGGTYFGDAVSC